MSVSELHTRLANEPRGIHRECRKLLHNYLIRGAKGATMTASGELDVDEVSLLVPG